MSLHFMFTLFFWPLCTCANGIFILRTFCLIAKRTSLRTANFAVSPTLLTVHQLKNFIFCVQFHPQSSCPALLADRISGNTIGIPWGYSGNGNCGYSDVTRGN